MYKNVPRLQLYASKQQRYRDYLVKYILKNQTIGKMAVYSLPFLLYNQMAPFKR